MREFAAHSETLTHFQTNGYIVIERFLSTSELEVLRQVLSRLQGDFQCSRTAFKQSHFTMQECDVIVEHAFEQLAAEGAVQPDWEASQRCMRLARCNLLQPEAACPGTQ